MQAERVGGKGILARFLVSLVLVYATFNPEGYSFFDWAIEPLVRGELAAAERQVPLKLLTGLLLLGLWVFFLKTTRRSIGVKGGLLVLAIVGVLIWLLIDWNVLRPGSSRAITHLVLIAVAVVLTLGMSWSHVSRRLSGQVDTDDIN
jgi:hypothetical protein